LVHWREQIAREKRAAFRDDVYWGRPVPGFGDPAARVLVLGLAPAAHGGNRTGRVFTGDRSGDWLFAAMFRAGFANQPESVGLDDGLRLTDAYVAAAVRCAPPDNKPLPDEISACQRHLDAEWRALPDVRVVIALGRLAFEAFWRIMRARGIAVPSPKPVFAHGAESSAPGAPHLIASFHPSQQNTFTGKLTPAMLEDVFQRAATLIAR
jgi:uracil-DNA glycosylase family 4